MTTTYDPNHPAYFQESDLRQEMSRVFDVCSDCRLCVSLCPSFPALFDAVDAHDGAIHALTHAEQDNVSELCYQCRLCSVKCPHTSPDGKYLDFPRLMLRSQAVSNRSADVSVKLAKQALGRADMLGRIGTATSTITNAVISRPGSLARRVVERATGIASERVLAPYARERFTTWFKRRQKVGGFRLGRDRQAQAAVFPSCMVEYQNPAVGQDLVKVYEHNGVECSLAEGVGCCGAPWLSEGQVTPFLKQAKRNVERLVEVVRSGRDIVVPQPTCSYVLKRDYPEYLGTPEARLVAESTYDAAEYLWKMHKSEGTSIDTDFHGEIPETVTYHAPCHLRAQNNGLRSKDLLRLTGAKVTVVEKCSGVAGKWGQRSENYALARELVQPLKEEIESFDSEVVAGDCQLANEAITQETNRVPQHPLQVLARAYGLRPELES